jgi:hypothetical protein
MMAGLLSAFGRDKAEERVLGWASSRTVARAMFAGPAVQSPLLVIAAHRHRAARLL